jgi:hypothetical protein
MNESNSGSCCCGCQYSTPPWWVTMGFIPPYGYQGPSGGTPEQGTPSTPNAPVNTTTTTAQPTTQQPSQSSGLNLGGLLNDVTGGLGSLLGGLF